MTNPDVQETVDTVKRHATNQLYRAASTTQQTQHGTHGAAPDSRFANCGARRLTRRVACYIGCLLMVAPLVSVAEGLSVKVGNTDLFPEIELRYEQTDNAYRTDADPLDSDRFILSPRLEWVADKGLTSLNATYVGSYAVASESNLEFADHQLGFNGETEFSVRSRAEASLEFSLDHEEAGIFLSQGIAQDLNELNTLQQIALSLEHTYGVRSARGNIVTGLDFRDINFNNNDNITRGGSQSLLSPYIDFSLRISGDTRGFLRLKHTTFDAESALRDGNALEAALGLKWDISGRTGGLLTLGQSTRSFDAGFEDQSTAVYELTAFYNPTNFSRFQLSAGREFSARNPSPENFQGEDSIADELTLLWDYGWSSRFSHRVRIKSEGVSRECPEPDTQRTIAGLDLNLVVRRWLSIGAGYTVESRDSSTCSGVTDEDDLDFDRQQISVFTRVTL